MKSKTFKTLDEQIDILVNKGLVVDDVEATKSILLRENYFFLSGYRHLFMDPIDNKRYLEGTTFKELYSMFLFDRQIRNIIFKNILIVENNLKSILAYVMSKNHGFKENNYLNPNNFVRDSRKNRQINDLIRKMKRQISVNGKQHTATAHYIINYGYIPLWVVVKVLSFGIVGELYTILQYQDQKEIADVFGVSIKNMVDYLPILANYRNLCAHEDICYINRTQKAIDDTKYHKLLYIPINNEEYIYGKNDLFALVIILKTLLDPDNFNLFINEVSYELDRLSGKLNVIKIEKVLHEMGFPNNYKEIVRLEK
ncbi:abortive infection bacteriophage resistance protein [Clostridium sp. CAG:609]|nr:abortive infection bacteriophage resistance protein [Clostridium sp. CAG:609]